MTLTKIAPKFEIDISSTTKDITNYVISAEYESSDTYPDEMRLLVSNPDNQISNLGLFQTGREVTLRGGYENNLKTIGRGIIAHIERNEAIDTIGTLEIIAYTKDYVMTKNHPKKGDKHPPVWKNLTDFSTVVKDIAGKSFYNFTLDVDSAFIGEPTSFVQPASMTDYEACNIIANDLGYLFWVSGTEIGWTLHFKNPNTTVFQVDDFSFYKDLPGQSNILDYSSEETLLGLSSVKAQYFDEKTKKYVTVELESVDNPVKSAKPSRTETSIGKKTGSVVDSEGFEKIEKASEVWIEIGGAAHRTLTNRKFQNKEQLKNWLEAWYERNNEIFITSEFTIPGDERLEASFVVDVSGFGGKDDGKHYCFNVMHKFDPSGELPFTTQLQTRRIPTDEIIFDLKESESDD